MKLSTRRLRAFNEYEAGVVSTLYPLDVLVLEHLTTLRMLDRLSPQQECAVRMTAEGYTQREVADEIGVSVRTTARIFSTIKHIYCADRTPKRD